MASEQTQPSAASEESNVCVAVKIRPLVAFEIDDGCRESLFVTPGCPQVGLVSLFPNPDSGQE